MLRQATADWCSRTSALSDDDFTVDSSSSAFTWISLNSSGRLKLQFTPLASRLRGLTFHVGNSAFSFRSADEIEDFSTVSEREWNNTGLSWSVGDAVSLSLTIPSTTGVSTISTPRFGNTYLRGEHIEIAVDFSEAVTVSGAPQLHLALGDDPANLAGKAAAYNRGSGTTRLVFRYTVESGIQDTSGINLYSNPLRLNGGTIRVGSTNVRRTLSDWTGLQPTQNIDGAVTYATGASIVSTPRFLNSYIQGEHIEVAVDFSEAVTVAGFPRLFLALGDDPANLAEKAAAYNRGSGTTRLVFRYTVESGIKDTTGINLYSNPLRLAGGTIRKGSNDARLNTLPDWLTLMPMQSVNGARVDAACPAPNLTGKQRVWTGTMTVEEDGGTQGFNDRSTAFGSLDHDDFSIGSTDYEVNAINLFEGEADVESDSILNFNLAPEPSTELVASLTLYVCDAAFTLGNAVESPDSFGTSYIWQNNNLVWSTVATRTLYLAVQRNTAASGRPAISGTATVGSTLTATRGTIADADGVPARVHLQLPVDPRGREQRERHFRRDLEHLHAGHRRRRQEIQGEGELHGQPREQGGAADQRHVSAVRPQRAAEPGGDGGRRAGGPHLGGPGERRRRGHHEIPVPPMRRGPPCRRACHGPTCRTAPIFSRAPPMRGASPYPASPMGPSTPSRCAR